MSYVYSAFALAYAAFEIPTAWWADRFGTRKVLARIVVWWSAFHHRHGRGVQPGFSGGDPVSVRRR